MKKPSMHPSASAQAAVLPNVLEDLFVCGKLLGTYKDWNQLPGALDFAYFDFTPAEGVEVPAGDLEVNYETGELTITPHTDGGVRWTGKILAQIEPSKVRDVEFRHGNEGEGVTAAAVSISVSLKRIADSLDNTTWNAAIEAAAAKAMSIKADATSDWPEVINESAQMVTRHIRSLAR